MFHVLIGTYEKPLDVVEQTRPAHLAWLNDEVAAGRLLLAGRQESGVGGLLITADISTEAVQDIIDRDPYTLAGVATYQRVSFNGGIRAAGL
ncbi:YciI family protein [Mycobacterium sp. CVI_P3]|uniref:YciI family protein n=1 Tax=Mycobacterium pinniadriaticum TaxID=2994102 RepID=A0ABT3SLE7_9MYCO|nr:YciI family protein [Mycobacterium pinniadriaticum]MCX2933931.1 YciI family protein [Mycobacterium pinniadriaticum]MCX2940353.1 YciI family protein [Mycobacterium pinniadriaticum]